MKTDKTQLLQDIEAMKEKLASMEEELNKLEEYQHFPRMKDTYFYWLPNGSIEDCYAINNNIKPNTYKTIEEAREAYNKAVALEKVKRRLLELQGDWKPDWTDKIEEKHCIQYSLIKRSFISTFWFRTKQDTSIPYMKSKQIARLIIYELKDELKLIFDIQ